MNDPEEILNVLVIEDNPDDAELLLREFKRAKLAVEAQVVSNAGAIEAAFAEGDWDVVLSDYNIPGTSFSHTLSLAKEADSHMPVIVVSGAVGEEVAVQLMREGASDLILKHNMSKLVPIVERELNVAEQNRARRESERRFMDIVMASADWVWETDSGHCLSFDMGGREQAEWSDPLRALGRTHWEAVGADPEVDTNWREHKRVLDSHEPFRDFRFCFTSPVGQEYHISMNGIPVFSRSGNFQGYRGTATDETLVVDTYMRAENAEVRLRDLIENLPHGVLVSDERDKLVAVNRTWRQLYSEIAGLLRPGTPYAAIEQKLGELGTVVRKVENGEGKSNGNGRTPESIWTLPGGQRLLVSEGRMRNGGRIQLQTDVTTICAG